MTDYSEMRSFAEGLAQTARGISLPYFRKDLEVLHKADESPVTRADRETEARLRTLLAQHYPDSGLFGEEEGSERLDAEYVWVVDPIDGTQSFVSGNPLFGTLIALAHCGRPVVGIIDMPVLEETWIGVSGTPTLYRTRGREGPVRTRACTALADATVCATSVDIFRDGELAAFERVSRRARVRRFGGDCYQYGRLAAGDVDLVIEAALKAYDFMALVPVVDGAGGVITDWSGRPLDFTSDGRIVAAATPELHREALALLAD